MGNYDCVDKPNFGIVKEDEEKTKLDDGVIEEAIYGEDGIPIIDESQAYC